MVILLISFSPGNESYKVKKGNETHVVEDVAYLLAPD